MKPRYIKQLDKEIKSIIITIMCDDALEESWTLDTTLNQ